jgi:hypothetical protein
MFGSSAGALGNLLGGITLSYFSPKVMFLFFAILLLLQFFSTSLQLSFVQFNFVQYIMFSDQTIDCHKKSKNKPLGFHFLVVYSSVLSFHFLKTSHSVDTFSGYKPLPC